MERGFFDRLIGLPRTLPGPWWVWPFVVAALIAAIPTALTWVFGSQSVGVVDPRIWLPALLSGYFLGMVYVLDRVALSAFRRFEPALGERPDTAQLQAKLISLPDLSTAAVVVILLVLVTLGYFSQQTELAYLQSRPLVEQASILIANWISISLGAIALVHTYVQLRAVSYLHRDATAIDLFDAAPAHAFARLTAATGVAVLIVGIALLGDPAAVRDSVYYLLLGLGVIGVATAAFALPLQGLHARLTREKAVLMGEVNERLKVIISRIHAGVDGDDPSASEGLNQALTSLIAERNLVGSFSTWPWSTGTIRGFASALLLPIALWFITRALERFL